ncbi:MAG: hypothetical protein ACI8ZM_000690 [Crocinitomix sp.]|jgi:hypothetical protein
MKSLRTTFIFLSFLFITNVASAQATIYMTADDFGKEETTVFKEVALVKNSLILSSEDGSAKVYNLKKDKVWGYRNNFGEDFRIKNAGSALRIIEYGQICIYSTINDISTTSNPDINPRWEDNPYVLSKAHSFSIGATGKIIKFSNGRFLKAFKGNAPVYQKFEKLINSGSRELLLKVIEHNAAIN